MNRFHILVALFVFCFVGLALASAPQAPVAPADSPAGCAKKDVAGCCKKDGDAATCKKDAAACPMKKNADGVATAKDGCCDPGMECCKDGKCCVHHGDEKPAKDAATAVTVSDEATSAADGCCGSGSGCCKPGSSCCADAA